MQPDNIDRRLENLIRFGTIAEVRYSRPPCARVKSGGLTTNWLRWLELRAGDTRDWDPPTVGEEVVILSPGGDLSAGVVLRGLLCEGNPEPSNSPDKTVRVFPDGTRYEHDHKAGSSSMTGMKSFLIEASDRIELKTKSIRLNADLTTSTGKHVVEDLLSYLAGLSGKDGKGNTTAISGDFTHVGGKLSSNGVVLHMHVHVSVQSGSSDSGGPK
ncbi:phage baseplate assembly protein V [Alcaligenaceae bacterium SJ-26]|nr:phage baseplate assembly protein V [Alcaligenaceae bacterium SJ-26]